MNLSKESEEIWTKEKYLNDIQSLIMTYPEEKKKEVMMHYDRRFDLGIAYGKTPNEIVTYLGTPKKVVDSLSEQRILIHSNYSSNQHTSLGDKDLGRLSQLNTDNYSGRSKVETTVIVIALLFFNLTFIVGPFLGMVGVLFGFFGTSVVLIISAIVVPIAEPVFSTLNLNSDWVTYSTAFPWIGTVFVSMICLGLGILFSIVTWFLSKGLFYISRKYIVWNIEVISPNRKEEK